MAEDLAWAAEEIRTRLARVYPGEMEKGELAEETGLGADELRGGLEILEQGGDLNLNGEGYALNRGNGDAARKPAPAAGEDEPADDRDGGGGAGRASSRGSAVAAAAAIQAPGHGPSYRVTFTVQMAFAGARGENRDVAAWETAQAIEVQIADAVSEAVGIGCAVETEAVEAFDAPREVPKPPGKDESGEAPEEGEQDGSDDGGSG